MDPVRALSSSQARELAGLLPRSGLLYDPEVLETARGDQGAQAERAPAAIVRPRSTAQVSQVLAFCARERIPVTPRGAGTGKAGGCAPLSGGVVMSLLDMARIRELHPASAYAVVEPGVITGAFRREVEARGLFYPPDPASLETCTLGGNVATNAGGPLAVKYGVTGDQVLGLEAVLPSGEVIHTGRRSLKGVSGYDLTSCLVGSEGTLAVITAVIVRLRPRPRAVRTALLPFATVRDAAAAVGVLWASGVQPRTLELLDGPSLAAVRRQGVVSVPMAWGAVLIAEVDGEPAAADAEMARLLDALPGTSAPPRVASDEAEAEDLWSVRRALSAAVKEGAQAWVSVDVAVPPERIPDLCDFVARATDGKTVRTAIYGHAGDGNLHINLLVGRERHLHRAREVEDRIFRQALHLGGTLTGEHGIGSLRTRFLPWEHGETELRLMGALKRAWDPQGLLNPGKVLP